MKHFLLLFIVLLSCSDKIVSPYTDDEITDETVVELSNSYAWKLFAAESRNNIAENTLISPLSIQTAMCMAMNGAKGQTLSEMKSIFNMDGLNVASINASYRHLLDLLQKESGTSTKILSTNAFFYDKNRISLYDNYVKALEDNYLCTFDEQNFNDVQSSVDNMNQWISDHTKGKIDKLITTVKDEDIAFLINTLFFKAGWSSKFNDPFEGKFTDIDGSTILTPFLGRDAAVPFYMDADYSIADIPFRDSTFSLSLIMQGNSLTAQPFSEGAYLSLLKKLSYDRLFLAFPKMKISYKNNMVGSLQSLGMKEAFDGNADFSAMGTSNGNIFISQVLHQAVLQVDEEGVEGSAATSIGFAVTSAPPTMVFNRPFYLVLRHIDTNTILFLGKVNTTPL
ncbi:MAG: hypothetical protein H6567_08630 [Lewinellaceae bacterium]|nr:hypothetical protein [Lewinellaceae bacterium]